MPPKKDKHNFCKSINCFWQGAYELAIHNGEFVCKYRSSSWYSQTHTNWKCLYVTKDGNISTDAEILGSEMTFKIISALAIARKELLRDTENEDKLK
jgi:hypothetical protein